MMFNIKQSNTSVALTIIHSAISDPHPSREVAGASSC